LIRVRQPEQETNDNLDMNDAYNTSGKWTAKFTYDLMGNVLTAIDANGTTITNTYDKANRVTTKTYSNEPNGQTTPAVQYLYDGFLELSQPSTASPNYAKGKLTKVTSSVSETRYTDFDYLGRLTQMQQFTDGQTYTSGYEYNFAGALIKETYPSGRVVRKEYKADGDLLRIYGQANSNAPVRTYANSFSFNVWGGIERMKLGNGKWETAKLNERQQLIELGLGNSSVDASLWKVNYEYGEFENGTVSTAKNTGNIAKQTITFAGLANPIVQTYKYDSLERLTEAKETSNKCTKLDSKLWL
jgi:YD repeat-containing protein